MADFTQHHKFKHISGLVNEALATIAQQIDCVDELHQIETQTNRVADDMAKLFIRAYKINHG